MPKAPVSRPLHSRKPETQKTHSSNPLRRTHHSVEPIRQTHHSDEPIPQAHFSNPHWPPPISLSLSHLSPSLTLRCFSDFFCFDFCFLKHLQHNNQTLRNIFLNTTKHLKIFLFKKNNIFGKYLFSGTWTKYSLTASLTIFIGSRKNSLLDYKMRLI